MQFGETRLSENVSRLFPSTKKSSTFVQMLSTILFAKTSRGTNFPRCAESPPTDQRLGQVAAITSEIDLFNGSRIFHDHRVDRPPRSAAIAISSDLSRARSLSFSRGIYVPIYLSIYPTAIVNRYLPGTLRHRVPAAGRRARQLPTREKLF